MKKVTLVISAIVLLYACGPTVYTHPSPTASKTSTSTTTKATVVKSPPTSISKSTNNTPQKSTAATATINNATPAIIYKKHPNATPLLSWKELLKKKDYRSLEEALKNPSEVYRLSLSGKFGERTITADISKFYNLQQLKLYNLFQEDLPKEIGKLKNLQYIDFQSFMFRQPLPKEVVNWNNLKEATFVLGEYENKYVPQNFLDNLTNVQSLKSLSISGKAAKRLPANISKLRNLKKLKVRNAPNFVFDQSLKNNTRLEKIYLTSLSTKSIPNSFGEIPNLKYLSINSCKNITKLPQELINKYHNKQLKIKLYSSGINFPLPAPNYANLSTKKSSKPYNPNYVATKYQKHPNSAKLLGFNELNKQKRYKTLAEALANPAEVFYLSLTNEGTSKVLSSRIGELYNLQKLVIKNIAQTELPKEIGKLKNLQHFILKTSVMDVPLPKEIENWEKLKSLQVELNTYNGQKMPEDFLDATSNIKSLRKLVLEGQSISRLPKNLEKLKWLSEIKINNTSNFILPNNLNEFKKVTSIKFKNTKLDALPTNIADMRYLQILSFYKVTGLKNIPAAILENVLKDKLRISTLKSSVSVDKNYNNKQAITETNKANVKKIELSHYDTNKPETIELWKQLNLYPNLYRISVAPPLNKYSGPTLTNLKSLTLTSASYKAKNTIQGSLGGFLNKTPNLQYLNSRDAYRSFPSDIYHLTQLKYLHLWMHKGHKKVIIPKDISNLKNLEELTVLAYHGTMTINVSAELYKLTKLKKLTILANGSGGKTPVKGKIAGGINNLTNLEVLELNCITNLPAGLEQLKQLKKLWIVDHAIPQQKIDWIKKQLPNTEIYFN